MQNKKIFFLLVFISLLALPIISAYSFGLGGGYYSDPMYYLQSPWVMFTIYFIFFFAIIYFTTNKSFKNPQVSAVVGGALSLFIAMALGQRGYLDYYMSAGVASWALVIASLIAIGFSIKFAYETFGRIGSVAAILIIWFVLNSTDPGQILPPELLNDSILNVYGFIAAWPGLVILLLLSTVIITSRATRRGGYGQNFMDSLFGRN